MRNLIILLPVRAPCTPGVCSKLEQGAIGPWYNQYRTLATEVSLRRLFSTFADGWAGFDLLIQRPIMGIAPLQNEIMLLEETPTAGLAVPEIAGSVLGLFLLAGLWAPVAGALVAAIDVWIVLAGGGNVWVSVILAILGGTLAMIGPGAWSIDARLFGKKHIAS